MSLGANDLNHPIRAPLSKAFLGIRGLSAGASGAIVFRPYTSTGGSPACCISAERPACTAGEGEGEGKGEGNGEGNGVGGEGSEERRLG